MNYNIVTNFEINNFIRQNSKYYKIDLGQALTLEDRSGDRITNQNDKFSFVYNAFYKAAILRQGSIGDITFYTDHEIREEIVVLYIDREEFVHSFERNKILESGIDSYLGGILKISQDEYNKIKDQEQVDLVSNSKNGSAEKVINNPGGVRFEDVEAYLKQKNSERLKS